jgi:hypothetical protein
VELRREITVAKGAGCGKAQRSELTALFKRLYEDNVLGRVTLSSSGCSLWPITMYEQKSLRAAIPVRESQTAKLMDSASNVDSIIDKQKRNTEIREL